MGMLGSSHSDSLLATLFAIINIWKHQRYQSSTTMSGSVAHENVTRSNLFGEAPVLESPDANVPYVFVLEEMMSKNRKEFEDKYSNEIQDNKYFLQQLIYCNYRLMAMLYYYLKVLL